MTVSKQLTRIERKIPKGKKLPAGFTALGSANLPIRLAWSGLKSHGLLESAEQEMVPFIHVADGSLVALWFSVTPPAVALIDAHGESPRVIAKDFPNFLRAISASRTGVPDIDNDCAEITIRRFTGKPVRAGVAGLQRSLAKWVSEHTSNLNPNASPDAEVLRKRIHKVARHMIRDGLSAVYKLRHDYWDMDYRIQRKRNALLIEYLDYGKWYAVPIKYDLVPLVASLLSMAKNQKQRKYEMTVTKDGIVSVDDDKQLVLVPPE